MRTVTETIFGPDGSVIESRPVELPEVAPTLAETVAQIDETVAVLAAEVLGV